jgi:hypothetical protein
VWPLFQSPLVKDFDEIIQALRRGSKKCETFTDSQPGLLVTFRHTQSFFSSMMAVSFYW